MPPERRLTVVTDGADDGRLSAALGQRARPASGIVVLHPVPGTRLPPHLAGDLVVALGKRHDAAARERRTDEVWLLLRLWFAAERVRHLVVLDAHRLPALLWTALLELTSTTRCAVWMVTRGTLAEPALAALAAGAPCTPDQLLARLPCPLPNAGTDALARRVRWGLTPAPGCAMVLAAVANLDDNALSILCLRHLPQGARTLIIDGRRWSIPSELRAPVRAHLLRRAARNAGPERPLLADVWGRRADADLLRVWVEQVTSPHPVVDEEEPWPYGPRGPGRLTVRGSTRRTLLADIGPFDH